MWPSGRSRRHTQTNRRDVSTALSTAGATARVMRRMNSAPARHSCHTSRGLRSSDSRKGIREVTRRNGCGARVVYPTRQSVAGGMLNRNMTQIFCSCPISPSRDLSSSWWRLSRAPEQAQKAQPLSSLLPSAACARGIRNPSSRPTAQLSVRFRGSLQARRHDSCAGSTSLADSRVVALPNAPQTLRDALISPAAERRC